MAKVRGLSARSFCIYTHIIQLITPLGIFILNYRREWVMVSRNNGNKYAALILSRSREIERGYR